MKNLTLAQAIVLVACLAAPVAAYALLDDVKAAAAVAAIGMVVNFMLGRDSAAKPE